VHQVYLGNKIYSVSDVACSGKPRDEVEALIRGPPKSTVVIGLIRDAGTAGGLADGPMIVNVPLERERIVVPAGVSVAAAVERSRQV